MRRERVADEGAGADLRDKHPFRDQPLDGVDGGCPRNPEFAGENAGRGQAVARFQHPGQDDLAQRHEQLDADTLCGIAVQLDRGQQRAGRVFHADPFRLELAWS